MRLDKKNKAWITGNKPFKFIQFKNVELIYPDQIFYYDFERYGICVNSWREMWEVVDVLEKLKIPYHHITTVSIKSSEPIFIESYDELVYKGDRHFEIDSCYNLNRILQELKKLGFKTSWEYKGCHIIA